MQSYSQRGMNTDKNDYTNIELGRHDLLRLAPHRNVL